MYFPSKKDVWFSLIIWGVILAIIFLTFFGGESTGTQFISIDSAIGRILMIIITIPLIWIWFSTGYMVENAEMKIRFGPIKWTVKINEIRKISKVKNLFSAPALSIYRLEVQYGKYGVVSISPKKEFEFIRRLLKENPQIQLDVTLPNDY